MTDHIDRAAEVLIEHSTTIVRRCHCGWCKSQAEHIARALSDADLLISEEHDAERQRIGAEKVAEAIRKMVPLGAELRPDGSEDYDTAVYVQAVGDAFGTALDMAEGSVSTWVSEQEAQERERAAAVDALREAADSLFYNECRDTHLPGYYALHNRADCLAQQGHEQEVFYCCNGLGGHKTGCMYDDEDESCTDPEET